MRNLVRKKVILDDHGLVYYEGGSGIPVLFVHGISTYSFIWRDIISYFLKDYRVIVVDLLGCGESDFSTDIPFSIANHADFMHKLMAELAIGKFHLVAHDVGGGVAQIMSVKNPAVLLSVSLINPVAYNFWPVQPIIAMRTPIIRQLAVASLDGWTLKMIIKRGLFHQEYCTAELVEDFRKPFRTKEGRKAFLHFAASLNNNDLMGITDKLHQLDTNFLIVRGESDVYLSASITQELIANLKHCESMGIPTAGHYAMIDEPEIISNRLLAFIKQYDN